MQSRKNPFLTKHIALLALTLCLLTGYGCKGYGLVNPHEQEALSKIRSGEYELVRKDELAKLREEAALGKSVGRYQQFSRSARTFRLDPATGETCILLTTVDTSTCTFQQTRLSSV